MNEPMHSDEAQPKWRISRRGFLVGMAATGTALALGIPLGLPVVRRQLAGMTEGDAGGFFSGIPPAAIISLISWSGTEISLSSFIILWR